MTGAPDARQFSAWVLKFSYFHFNVVVIKGVNDVQMFIERQTFLTMEKRRA